MTRVIAYVDGFNLYFGMKEAQLRSCYWLDVRKFGELFLRNGQTLNTVKYFTARISGPPDKKARQEAYLEALKTIGGLEIFEGKFATRPVTCDLCKGTVDRASEKMTDVNIASELLVDAFEDRFDTAFLISGDSDLVPPLRHVLRLPSKRVFVIFPPKRVSLDLKCVASGFRFAHRAGLFTCQFPGTITRIGQPSITRPAGWA